MSKSATQQKNVPELRFPEFSGEWQKGKLSDVGKIQMCKRVMKHETLGKGDIPFFKIGTFGKNPDAFITKELYESYKEKYPYPKQGDILISASGTIGRTVVYDDKPAYFQDSNIVWIDNDERLVYNSFLFFLYKNTNWITAKATIARIYSSDVKVIRIA